MMIAVMIMAFSTVSAFAVSSPVATQPCNPGNPDTSGKSPKTGYSDIMAYTMIAVSVIGCGAASVALVKAAKKN